MLHGLLPFFPVTQAKKRLHQQQLMEARRTELDKRKDGTQEGGAAAAVRSKAMRIHALIPRVRLLCLGRRTCPGALLLAAGMPP